MEHTPYLIQRAKFRDSTNTEGIDSILSFDYMGSAEFEFGALPKSLKEIRKDISTYTYLDIPFGEKVLTVFCKDSDKSEMKQVISDIIERKFRLKEFCDVGKWINEEKGCDDKFYNDFWWDLDNNFMFWKKNPEFELKFKELIETKK